MDAKLQETHRLPDIRLAKYLTDRQRQFVMLLSAGVCQRDIAKMFKIEQVTVYKTLLDADRRLAQAAAAFEFPHPERMTTLMWCRWGCHLRFDVHVVPAPAGSMRRADRPAIPVNQPASAKP